MAAYSSSSSSSSFLAIATLLVVLTTIIMSSGSNTCEAYKTTTRSSSSARGPAAAAAVPVVAAAPEPSAASRQLNLSGILEKGGQYTTLMRLLKESQVGEQIQSQLNNSFEGFTIFAPTDNAFNKLKAGTLNRLTPEEQVSLILYHVLPKYYSLATFETTSNPVRTQASGNKGVYNLNITSTSSQVNVSTGVDDSTQISNKLYSDFPLAVYSVDSVLLPYDIFGPKSPPAAAAAPSTLPPGGKVSSAKAPATSTSSDQDSTTTPSAASLLRVGSSALVAAALCFMITSRTLL